MQVSQTTKFLLPAIAVVAVLAGAARSQIVRTIVNNGSPAELYDMVILGDGYRAAEQAQFDQDVQDVVYYFQNVRSLAPYGRYFQCYNVHSVFRASAESGADQPDLVPPIFRNTAYDASYNIGGTPSCLYIQNEALAAADAALAPDTDGRVMVLVNEPFRHGGGAGNFAVGYNGTSKENVQAREWSHAFGQLADEDDYGSNRSYSGPEPAAPNITADSTGAKWSPWLGFLGQYSRVGTNEGAGTYARGLFRPETHCGMRSLGRRFCTVCREHLIKRFHQECTMIGNAQPAGLTLANQYDSVTFSFTNRLASLPHTIEWQVDGGPWTCGASSFTWHIGNRPAGFARVGVRLINNTAAVRNDPAGDLVESHQWTISVRASGIGSRPVRSPVNGRAYLITAPMTWAQAQTEALRRCGHLATVRSQAEQDWISTTYGYQEFWIGLHDEKVENQFEWISGEPVTYTNWRAGEPNNGWGNEHHTVVAVTGDWNDLDGNQLRPALIEMPAWIRNPSNGHDYAVTAPMTWARAQAEALRIGGHLATVRSQTEQDWAVGAFGPREIWIGLHDESFEGQFKWVSGEPVTYTNWRFLEPSNSGGNEDHTVITVCGEWNDLDGTEVRPALIERPQWIRNPNNGRDYTVTAPMTWAQAQARAMRLGGDLATVRSQAEQDWIFGNVGSQELWIGLQDENVEGRFEWASGEPVTYTNWGAGEPNNSWLNEDHTVMLATGVWNDLGIELRSALIERSGGFATFGVGCAGSRGVPALQVTSGTVPRPGENLTITITNVPLTAPTYLFVGAGKFMPALNVSPLGMPGCTLQVRPDMVLQATNVSGTAGVTLAMPAILGGRFFVQAVILDPAANPLGWTTSDAADLAIRCQ